MKPLVFMILLAILLAGCASTQGGSGGYGQSRNTSLECQKIQAGGWGVGNSPCR
jgi:hypothetical protein